MKQNRITVKEVSNITGTKNAPAFQFITSDGTLLYFQLEGKTLSIMTQNSHGQCHWDRTMTIWENKNE